MNKLNLTTIEPLEVKLDFNLDSKSYDLHNDFDCNEVIIENENLILLFQSEQYKLRMVFQDFEINPLDSFLSEKSFGTLDNFNLHSSEDSPNAGIYCFTISFIDTAEYELSCSSAFLEVLES